MIPNDLFLRACRGETIERPPVWMMRQAGRYLPEYRAVRAKSDFLTMCRTPELAAQVTLQPVELIGVDAAIIFSDILVIPEAMGMHLVMEESVGPQFPSPVRTLDAVQRLRDVDPETDLKYMLDGIRLVKRELGGRVPLIGFAGAPWTLAAYMIEGKGTKQFAVAKKMLFQDAATAHALLARLATAVGNFLLAQARAGAQALQLFESWAGALSPHEFRTFALPYLARTAAIARTAGVPLIVFAPGAGWALELLAEATGADVIGVDWHTDAAEAKRRLQPLNVTMQGNLDPCVLYATPDVVRDRTLRMLDAFGGQRHIANLGHGILPDSPVESAKMFVETVKGWRSPAAETATAPVRAATPEARPGGLGS
jgi:uroporphyrinogen decarboxylase